MFLTLKKLEMFIIFMLAIFMMSMHSMSAVFLLCVLTLIYSVFMFKVLGTFWFSYVMLMVMLSGILVIFSYIASLSSNESMNFNLISLLMLTLMFFYSMILENCEGMDFLSMKMWDQSLVTVNMSMIVMLFMLMLMVIWVSSMNEGSIQGFEKIDSWK